jgi:hypothetical protein
MIPALARDIQAQKRPLAVLLVYGAELAWALVVAAPVHAFARRVWGAHPEGDAVLFRAGGRELLVWLGQTDAGLGVTTSTALLLLVLGTVLMQLPLGALLASLAFTRGGDDEATRRRSLRPAEALRAGIDSFMPLAGALALGTVVAVIVLAAGAMASSAVEHAFVDRLGDARAFQLRLATFGLFLALAALLGVIMDLARAAIARETGLAAIAGTRAPAWSVMLRSVRTAIRMPRRDLGRATGAWAFRFAAGLALVAVGYYAAQSLGGRGGAALVGLFIVHQVVVLGRVSLRASWLARALVIVSPDRGAPGSVRPAHVEDVASKPESAPPAPEPPAPDAPLTSGAS